MADLCRCAGCLSQWEQHGRWLPPGALRPTGARRVVLLPCCPALEVSFQHLASQELLGHVTLMCYAEAVSLSGMQSQHRPLHTADPCKLWQAGWPWAWSTSRHAGPCTSLCCHLLQRHGKQVELPNHAAGEDLRGPSRRSRLVWHVLWRGSSAGQHTANGHSTVGSVQPGAYHNLQPQRHKAAWQEAILSPYMHT